MSVGVTSTTKAPKQGQVSIELECMDKRIKALTAATDELTACLERVTTSVVVAVSTHVDTTTFAKSAHVPGVLLAAEISEHTEEIGTIVDRLNGLIERLEI